MLVNDVSGEHDVEARRRLSIIVPTYNCESCLYECPESAFAQLQGDCMVKRNTATVSLNDEAGISFAIGAYWSDGSADIRTAFLHADELMYADKDEFYKNNPDLPRR